MPRLRIAGIAFVILSTFFIAFPPWVGHGYGPLWDPPSRTSHLDIARLMVQLAGGACVSFWIGFFIAPICRASTRKIAPFYASRRRVIGITVLVLFALCCLGAIVIFCKNRNADAALLKRFNAIVAQLVAQQAKADQTDWGALADQLLGPAPAPAPAARTPVSTSPLGPGWKPVGPAPAPSPGYTGYTRYELLRRGIAYTRASEFDKAIAEYTEAIRIAPQCAEAFFCRGFTYLQKGDRDKAELDFDRAKQLGLTLQ